MKRLIALLVATLLAVAGLGAVAGVAQATTLSFGATADTFVNSNTPTQANGTGTVARVNHGTVDKISLFKFAVAGIPAGETVSSATLTLTTSADAQNADTLDVYNVGSTWTESTTYNTRPTLGTLVGHVAVTGPNQAVSIAVPVTGNGTVSFAVWKTTAANGDNVLATRENTTVAARPKLVVNSAATPVNQAPTVSAGVDKSVTMPSAVTLSGTVTDDGLPNPPGATTATWSKFSGPGTVTFANPNAASTTATFSVAGTYDLRLTGSDGSLSTSDDMIATVAAAPANQAPVVNAGTDQSLTLPTVANLSGTASDDGLPAGSTLTTTWSKFSGPGTVTFGNANALSTTASFSVAGTYDLRLSGTDGTLTSTDDMIATVAAAAVTFPACPSTTVTPFPSGTTLSSQYKVGAPGSSTYDLTGVTDTAYPATASPFAFGTSTEPADFCMKNGIVAGTTDDNLGWTYYHDNWNASCVRIVATHMAQANGLRCHDIEDGLKFLETNGSGLNLNTTTFYSQGTYLNRVRDDCIENDYTLGGYLYDSLWDGCNTGVSERPASANGSWTSPANETLTLDHMNIGLWPTWHEADGKTGENALFKWSSSANHLVIKCSTFKVDSVSLNGASSNDIPAGTVVDDSACPNNPTTIVWLGGGAYPGNLQGLPITVTSNAAVWTNAVANWKAAHGY